MSKIMVKVYCSEQRGLHGCDYRFYAGKCPYGFPEDCKLLPALRRGA